jgi:hypothetical protein
MQFLSGVDIARSVLKFAGMKPVRETLSGMVDAASDAKRRAGLTG